MNVYYETRRYKVTENENGTYDMRDNKYGVWLHQGVDKDTVDKAISEILQRRKEAMDAYRVEKAWTRGGQEIKKAPHELIVKCLKR